MKFRISLRVRADGQPIRLSADVEATDFASLTGILDDDMPMPPAIKGWKEALQDVDPTEVVDMHFSIRRVGE